jgi:replicative DNA helicase
MNPTQLAYEHGVLAGMIDSPHLIPDVLEILSPDDFANPDCREIFPDIVQRYEDGKPVNFYALSEQMRETKAALAKLAGGEWNRTVVTDLAQRVKAASVKRQLSALLAEAADDQRPARDMLDELIESIYKLTGRKTANRPKELRDVLAEFDTWRTSAEAKPARKTGYMRLDGLLGGMEQGQLIMLAARPALGKSAFGAEVAIRAARNGTKTLIFSCEMARLEIAQRYIARQSGVALADILRRQNTAEEMRDIGDAIADMTPLPLLICDDAGITTRDIRRVLQSTRDVGLIVVDYIQLMRAVGNVPNRNLEIAQISGDLKVIAKEFRLTVFALSQLNRAKDEKDEPALNDLRDSGSLEQDADKVILFWRIGEDSGRKKIAAKVAKNRMGDTGTLVMYFDGAHMQFTETAEEYVPKKRGRGREFVPREDEYLPPKWAEEDEPRW